MKSNFLKLTTSSVLMAVLFNTSVQAAPSCHNVLTNEVVAKTKSSLSSLYNIDHLSPQELRDLNLQISELESSIRDRGYRRSSIEKEANGEFTISFTDKTDALKDAEKLLRGEKEALERETRDLPRAKEDLESALAYLSKDTVKKEEDKRPSGILAPPTVEEVFSSSHSFSWEKKWTEEDVAKLRERIDIFTKNAPIRKSNIEIYNRRVSVIEAPIKAARIAKAKAELAEVIQKDTESQKQIEVLQERRTQLQAALRADAVRTLKRYMGDARLAPSIIGIMGYSSLKSLPTSNKVTVLIGSNLNGQNRIEYNQAVQVRDLVQGLVKRRYYVVFDAESSYAPYISQLAGEYGIPVMARSQGRFANHKNKIVIENDYQRMQILADAKAVIASPDSVTGAGLQSEGLLTHMLDVRGTYETASLRKWVEDLNVRTRNLGITARSAKILDGAADLFVKPESEFSIDRSSVNNSVENFVTFVSLKPETLSLESIKQVLSDSFSYAQVMARNSETGGSVIFGSSREDKYSANLIYQSAYKLGRLGIAVATGGAGGAMEIANSGAFNGGGPSIGIPIGGKHTLDNEKTVASSTHTKTIVTSGYEERIPVLLGQGRDSRKMIIFAPGGNGTIKELAVTLVRASGKFESFEKIIFLDSDYYGPLFNWFKKSQLPKVLKDKMVLIDKADDLEVLAKDMQEDFERNRVQEPRKDQLTYEVKSYGYGGYGSFDSAPSGNGAGTKTHGKPAKSSKPSKPSKPVIVENTTPKYETWQYPPKSDGSKD